MIKTLPPREHKEIEAQLEKQFGIKSVSGKIMMLGAERLFFFTGDLDEKSLQKLEQITPIEKAGVYFAKLTNGEIKLTIEGTQILKGQIAKGTFNIDSKQTEEWMMGRELNIATGLKGFIVLKNRETGDFLGCGKSSEHKIGNFVPKSRRLKSKG